MLADGLADASLSNATHRSGQPDRRAACRELLLERVNPRLDEAAAILGAGRWETFWKITFPLIRPGLMAGVLYAFIIAFGDVPLSIFLSSSEYMTLPVVIFQTLQFDFAPTVLSMSTIIAFTSVIFLWLIQRFVGLDLVAKR